MYAPIASVKTGLFHLHPAEFGGNKEYGRARLAFVVAEDPSGPYYDLIFYALPSDLPGGEDLDATGDWLFRNAVKGGTGWNEFELRTSA